ncbi:MAG: hypothetical protein IPJ74_26200 [Saprospiraceae bacterium]|nr:hypothetical protein [Saprospiraceae bacterium]
MKLLEVNNRRTWRLFHQVLKTVYRHMPQYIFPLEKEIENVFDPKSNKAFEKGEAKCFVLLNDRSKPVGRIAAFIDHARNEGQLHKAGGIGYFECINDEDCADALFKASEDYLKSKGVEIIDGPINFGERDKFWGLLVKGQEFPPLYQENYHPHYYEKFFLEHNYKPFEQILTYKGATKEIPFERLAGVAKRLKERQPVDVKPLDFGNLEPFAHDFSEVYNASFRAFAHFKPISPAQVMKMMEQAKPIADPKIACIAYFEGHPAGFMALYPDVNPYLKHAKGKLNLWTIPIFLWKKNRAKTRIAKGMGFGIHPDYQSKGIFALLMDYLSTERNVHVYPYMCLAGIRTHNHEIRSLYAKLNVEIDRVHVAYRKYLNPAIPYEPFEFIKV